MRIVFDPGAERTLANQLGYLIDQGAAPSARKLEQRIFSFVEDTLAKFPRSGIFIDHRDL